ncbi:MAG: DUF6125 family protein [Thermaerobacter sp.]|nr:DUF6125 family protein [Thermaerobacter sp.]
MAQEVGAQRIEDLSRDELLSLLHDLGRRWLAHDGLWFQAVERSHGMEEAIALDTEAWRDFTVNEGRRIMRFLGMEEGGGLDALDRALRFRLYATVNEQESERPDERTLVFRMRNCKVQEARRRKGMPDFPCKSVGCVEYSGFARTIDPRIETDVILCPPDEEPRDYYCAWRFTMPQGAGAE